MRVFRDYRHLPDDVRGSSVAVGNFDGVHLGHRAVLETAKEAADRLGAPRAVLMFDPSPRQYFAPDAASFQVMSIERRAEVLSGLGVDAIFVLPFNEQLANMTDIEFAQTVLSDGLGARAVSVGFDFKFGKNRTGDASTLGVQGLRLGFETCVADKITDGEEKASSTRIRELLREGRVQDAARMLGDYWVIEAEVKDGEKRGRTIGFPTANMYLGDFVQPRLGVYAVFVRRLGEDEWRSGVASFGRTPTTGLRDPLLEVFLHDFEGDLYGQKLDVAFVDFLRPEEKYDSLDVLVKQIGQDSEDARTILNKAARPLPATRPQIEFVQ